MDKAKIGIIMSTSRQGRFGEKPAHWMFEAASKREDLEVEIVDLRDYPLPLYGETASAQHDGASESDVVAHWSKKMAELDGYIFITAEYNHSVPGVLKNALDHVYSEVGKKPAAFVGYGGVGGARAVEQLRLICIELQMAPTRTAVHIGMEPYLGVRKHDKRLSDYDYLENSAAATLEELAWWTKTLRAGRVEESEMDTEIEEVLQFWFGKADEPDYGEFRQKWFSAEPEFDEEIRERFLRTYAEARAGRLDHWQEHPRSALALVIVLDQFSRNMFRDTPGMYETDGKAHKVAEEALKKGFDRQLPEFQRWFLYMPLVHSEDLDDQYRAIELFQANKEDGAGEGDSGDWHLRTIERFGRFPHRNEILGRESTPE